MKALKQNGFIVPTILINLTFIITIAVIIMSLTVSTHRVASRESFRQNAQFVADAGLDIGIHELNLDSNWAGTLGEVTLLDDGNVRTTYETTVLPGASELFRTIAVVGRTYSPSDSEIPKIERRYELDVQAVTSGTNVTSVVSGVGGLNLNNNSRITGGDVVVNGRITMSNQSQIGTQTNSVNVRVAHQSCPQPANSTYPQICGPGNGQPISMQNNARIYGEVHANNQTTGTNMTNPGLIVGQTVTPVSLPEYDRGIHSGATDYSPSASGIACPNNGTLSWPANIRITGNYNMGNNCTLTVNGNVWVTGNFTTGNNGRIIVSETAGLNRPVFMVDGQSGFTLANNGEIEPNSSGTGIEVRTFWSHSSSGCSPNCTNLTGVGLANSQNVTTIDLGNNGNAPNSVFIAQWSRVNVSNNGALGAVAGQSINLSNQAVINFTASIPGSDNLVVTWVKRGYLRTFE